MWINIIMILSPSGAVELRFSPWEAGVLLFRWVYHSGQRKINDNLQERKPSYQREYL